MRDWLHGCGTPRRRGVARGRSARLASADCQNGSRGRPRRAREVVERRLHRPDGWSGADVAGTVVLGDGRVVWLFGDTWIGTSATASACLAREWSTIPSRSIRLTDPLRGRHLIRLPSIFIGDRPTGMAIPRRGSVRRNNPVIIKRASKAANGSGRRAGGSPCEVRPDL